MLIKIHDGLYYLSLASLTEVRYCKRKELFVRLQTVEKKKHSTHKHRPLVESVIYHNLSNNRFDE